MNKPEDLVKGNERLLSLIDEDNDKSSLMDTMVAKDDGMATTDVVEHKYFKIIHEMFGDGWHVIPNPRKNEVIDVFIFRDDGAVLKVSMKTASVTPNSRDGRSRKITNNGMKNWEHADVVLAFDHEMMYVIEPDLAYQKKQWRFSPTLNHKILKHGIRYATEEGKQKARDTLAERTYKCTLEDL